MWLEQNRRGISAISLEKEENLIIFIATVSLFLFTVNKLHQRENYICTKHFNPTRVTMTTRTWQRHVVPRQERVCREDDAAGKTSNRRPRKSFFNLHKQMRSRRVLCFITVVLPATSSINFVNSVIFIKVKKEGFMSHSCRYNNEWMNEQTNKKKIMNKLIKLTKG